MLVSHSKKFIFLKIPKTASTSLEMYFEKYCVDPDKWDGQNQRDEAVSDYGIVGARPKNEHCTFYNHMPVDLLVKSIGQEMLDSYFVFSSIRNPYEVLVSKFLFNALQRNVLEIDISDEQSVIANFRTWIKSNIKPNHFSRFCFYKSKMVVDYFIQHQDILTGLKTVCDRLDIDYEPENLQHSKRTKTDLNIPLSAFYSDELVEMVESYFKFELEYFNYQLSNEN